MSSQEVDYDALAATTSVEEMSENECNWDTLRSLKNDDLSALCLCTPEYLANDRGDYVPDGSRSWDGWDISLRRAHVSKALTLMGLTSSKAAVKNLWIDSLKTLDCAIILKR